MNGYGNEHADRTAAEQQQHKQEETAAIAQQETAAEAAKANVVAAVEQVEAEDARDQAAWDLDMAAQVAEYETEQDKQQKIIADHAVEHGNWLMLPLAC